MLRRLVLAQDFKNKPIKYLSKLLSLLYFRKLRIYHRVLPFSEYFNDRFKKAEKLGWGAGSSCYDSVYIYGDVSVGKNTFVGPFCVLDGSGGLEIGESCSIAAGVHIYTYNSVKWATSGGKEMLEYSPVKIGNNCYIGPNCVISMGVTIGDGAIVGAGSFVNKDVQAFYSLLVQKGRLANV